MEPHVEAVVRTIRNNQWKTRFVAGLCLLPGFAFVAAGMRGGHDWSNLSVGAMVLIVCLGLLLVTLKNPLRHRELNALREGSRDVVWMYPERRQRNGVHVASALVVGYADGRSRSVPIPVGREQEMARAFAAHVPHAAIGYHPEMAARFKSNPASLRQG